MKRAAIYARYSTDLQSERSIQDQFALCRSYAFSKNLSVVATFEDRARSGASTMGRDGLHKLMLQAEAHAFDVVVVEHSDRIARNMKDLAGIHERLTFLGIEICAVHSGGTMDTALIGLFGLVGQMQREDGAKKVRRGMAGVVREGRHAGGRPYGYRTVPGQVGKLAIEEQEAEVIRRILSEYVNGRSPRAIAKDLNRENVPPPRGKLWNASTIKGNARRGNGLVFNELYVGRIIWNKIRMLKNPETGKRVSRPNVRSQWQVVEAPGLRIVDEDLWQQVREVNEGRTCAKPHLIRRHRHLLSGLLRCGCCESGMSVHDRDKTGKIRVRCSAVRENGACTNRRILYLPAIEQAVVGGMQEHLRDPRLIEVYVRRYNEQRHRLAVQAARDRGKLERQLDELEREYDRVFAAYRKGFITEAEAEAQLPTLRAERERVASELATAGEEPRAIALHPSLITGYLRQVDDLAATLSDHLRDDSEAGDRLTHAFRSLVHSVTVYPFPVREGFDVEVKGRLAELVGKPMFPVRSRTRNSGGWVVAEEGFEPPTQGL
jgi:site-specific DNA recombinase